MPRFATFRATAAIYDIAGDEAGALRLLVVYAVTAIGVPLPAGVQSTKSVELFPCAASGCGCNSAERCWRSCCCHTLAERLNWARKNGVRPPQFAIAAARESGLDVCWLDGERDSAVAGKVCCVAKVGPSTTTCCSKSPAAESAKAIRTCCAPLPDHDRGHDQLANTADAIIGWRALACKGHSVNWMAAVPSLVVAYLEVRGEIPLVEWLGRVPAARAFGTADVPAVPPPEMV